MGSPYFRRRGQQGVLQLPSGDHLLMIILTHIPFSTIILMCNEMLLHFNCKLNREKRIHLD